MYDLPYHKAPNEQVVKEFIENHPFAFLSGCDTENQPVATQVPVFVEEVNGTKKLSGHLMRNSDHHKAFLHNDQVLAVFTLAITRMSAPRGTATRIQLPPGTI